MNGFTISGRLNAILLLITGLLLTTNCFHKIDMLEQELDRQKLDNKKLKALYEETKKQQANLQNRYNMLKQERDELDQEKRSLEDECKQKVADVETAKNELAQKMGEEIRVQSKSVDSLKEDLTQEKKNNESLANKLQTEQYNSEKLAKQVEEIKGDFNNAQNQQQLIEKKFKGMQDAITEKDNQIKKLEESIKAKEQEIADNAARVSKTEDELKSSGDKIKELEKNAKVATNEQIKIIAKEASSFFSDMVKLETMKVEFNDASVILIIFDQYLFQQGSVVLKPESTGIIGKLAEFLKKYPERNVEIQGHTDNTPVTNLPYPDNWGVASARAEKVLRALIQDGGIKSERLRSVSLSQYHPISDNSTPEGRARNRRVQIVILSDTTK